MAFQDDVLTVTPTGGTSPGLIAYWPAQEVSSATALADITSFARSATPINAAHMAFGVDAGLLGGLPGEKCVHIFDTDGYLTVSDATSWPSGAQPWTVMGAFRTVGDGGGDGYAWLSWGDYGTVGGSALAYAFDGSRGRHSIWGEATQTAHVFDGIAYWTLHFWRFDGTNRQAWVQGLTTGGGPPGVTVNLSAVGIHLGSGPGNTSRLNGYLAHVAVWRGILSEADIEFLSVQFINRIRPTTALGSTALDTALSARARLADWDFNIPANVAYVRDTAGDHTLVLSKTPVDTHNAASPFAGQTSVMLSDSDGDALAPFVPDAAFLPLAGPLAVVAVTRPRNFGDNGLIQWGETGGAGTEDWFRLLLLGNGAQRLDFHSEFFDHMWPRSAGSSLDVGWNLVLFSLAADNSFALWLDNSKYTGTLAGAPAWPAANLRLGLRGVDRANVFLQRMAILGQTLSDADAAALYAAYTSLWRPAPGAPTSLTATAIPGTGIHLAWVAPVGGTAPDGYVVRRATTSGAETDYNTGIPSGQISLDDTGVTPGTTYYYTVMATTSPAGRGVASNEASALALAPQVGTPTGLTATPNHTTLHIDLAWVAPTTGTAPDSYTVLRSTASGAETSLATGITALVYSDAAITPGIRYYYTVIGVAADAPASTPAAEVAAIAPFPPAPPNPATGLTAVAVPGVGAIDLLWVASAIVDPSSYTIKRGVTPGGETVFATGVTETSYRDTAVVPGVRYYYTVVATNSPGGDAAATPEASVIAPSLSPVRSVTVIYDWVGGDGLPLANQQITADYISTRPVDLEYTGPGIGAGHRTIAQRRVVSTTNAAGRMRLQLIAPLDTNDPAGYWNIGNALQRINTTSFAYSGSVVDAVTILNTAPPFAGTLVTMFDLVTDGSGNPIPNVEIQVWINTSCTDTETGTSLSSGSVARYKTDAFGYVAAKMVPSSLLSILPNWYNWKNMNDGTIKAIIAVAGGGEINDHIHP